MAARQGAPPDLAVYAAVVGDDPEWEVTGTMAGFDPDLSRVAAPALVLSGRWDGLTTPQPERYFALVGDFLSAARPAR